MPSGRLESRSDYEIRRFCCHKCSTDWRQGANHFAFKPEGSRRSDGYIRIAVGSKRHYLHRYLMEAHLGRSLAREEHVHHKDGNLENNDINNLELLTDSQHLALHYKERIINEKGRFV